MRTKEPADVDAINAMKVQLGELDREMAWSRRDFEHLAPGAMKPAIYTVSSAKFCICLAVSFACQLTNPCLKLDGGRRSGIPGYRSRL
jgi:hypothetical protein